MKKEGDDLAAIPELCVLFCYFIRCRLSAQIHIADG